MPHRAPRANGHATVATHRFDAPRVFAMNLYLAAAAVLAAIIGLVVASVLYYVWMAPVARRAADGGPQAAET